jgi:CRP-like cAMP-binding protein
VVAIRNTASESPQRTAPGSTVDPEQFRALPEFSNFERQEAEELLRVMRRCDLVGGTVLFHCGSPGRSCFVILNGEVDVTVQIRGQEQLLARLHEGSIFGQVALIEGCPRTATCIAHRDSVLLELDREPCEKIFAARKPLAYKLLAALNQGLISALRGADRQLMKLTEQNRVTWSAKASDSEHASDETRAYSPGTAGAQAKATILS